MSGSSQTRRSALFDNRLRLLAQRRARGVQGIEHVPTWIGDKADPVPARAVGDLIEDYLRCEIRRDEVEYPVRDDGAKLSVQRERRPQATKGLWGAERLAPAPFPARRAV
jgi:hypothetical protein